MTKLLSRKAEMVLDALQRLGMPSTISEVLDECPMQMSDSGIRYVLENNSDYVEIDYGADVRDDITSTAKVYTWAPVEQVDTEPVPDGFEVVSAPESNGALVKEPTPTASNGQTNGAVVGRVVANFGITDTGQVVTDLNFAISYLQTVQLATAMRGGDDG